MNVSRYTNASSHSRFYVFRHKTVEVNGAPVQWMEHLHECDGDEWNNIWRTGRFSNCELFDDDTAKGVAEASAAAGKERNDGFTYCVGKVFVEVDGFFEIVVMK